MILAAVVLVAVVAGLVAGGRIGRLRDVRLKHEAVLLAALVFQVLWPTLANVIAANRYVDLMGWLFSAAVMIVVLLQNGELRGTGLATSGICLNAVVIVANLGMPVDRLAAQTAGMEHVVNMIEEDPGFYHLIDTGTRFPVLADVLPIPGPATVCTVVSLGDMLLFLGIAVLVVAGMQDGRVSIRRGL